MKTGMLWFDNDPHTDLTTKISLAASFYQNKYGKKPDLCFVHPSMLLKEKPGMKEIEVRSTRQVLPHHLWMGLREPHPTTQSQ